MKTSEVRKGVIAALVKAQAAIGAKVKKDAKNPHFRNDYASLDAVLTQVSPHLSEHGLFLCQETKGAQGGVEVATFIFHESGESLEFDPIFVPASKQDAQGYGSAMTYARRYSLLGIFGLAPSDDDGNAAAASAPTAPITQAQAQQIREGITDLGADEAKFLGFLAQHGKCQINSIEEIPAKMLPDAMAAIEAKRKKVA
jgi:hypothetical protein